MSDTGADTSLLAEAQRLIDLADDRGIVLRLFGGLAIQFLCPELPPRTRTGQDLDLGTLGSSRRALGPFLDEQGYVPDKMFNALNGDKQQYYTHAQTGLAIDVLIDKLYMSHTLDFASRLGRLRYTLDPVDLLLSKLQIAELNEKDAEDCLRLLVSFEFADSDDPSAMDLRVFRGLVGDDWGWWKTITINLERIRALLDAGAPPAIAAGRLDPRVQLDVLASAAEDTPKSRRWRMRARIGERKRWYEVPDESEHE